MSTLMSTGNSSGETGRCDAKCYDAKGPDCNCCCGGRNHGAGYQKAVENIEAYIDNMIQDWQVTHPEDTIVIDPKVAQLELKL